MRCVAARRRFVTFDEKDGLGILEDFSLRLVPDFVNLTKSVQSLLKTLVPIAERLLRPAMTKQFEDRSSSCCQAGGASASKGLVSPFVARNV